MSDVTALYYTANKIPEAFAKKVRDHFSTTFPNVPVVSVSQKPMDFGENICLGDIGCSVYNTYLQVYEGAKRAKTKYVVCLEDDTLLSPEHVAHEPPMDTFHYNLSFWRIKRDVYYTLYRRAMSGCVASTELMVKTLGDRYAKYPTQESAAHLRFFGEPGRFEQFMALPRPGIDVFRTNMPVITFRHTYGLSKAEGPGTRCIVAIYIPGWGRAIDLWRRFME